MNKTFREFLKKQDHEDIGKSCIIYENLKGVIIGVQNNNYWVKVKGMQRQMVDPKDTRFLE